MKIAAELAPYWRELAHQRWEIGKRLSSPRWLRPADRDGQLELLTQRRSLTLRLKLLAATDPVSRERAVVREVLGIAFHTDPQHIRDSAITARFDEQARHLIAREGAQAVLASDWRTIRRGLAPTNYDDRTSDHPIPAWVTELASTSSYLGIRARVVIRTGTSDAPPWEIDSDEPTADRFFGDLQNLVDPDPTVRVPAEVRHFVEQSWGVGLWHQQDPVVYENFAAHIAAVGLDEAMAGDVDTEFRRVGRNRLMDLRHEQREREGHVLDDLRDRSYWAHRDFARIEHSAPTGCLDEILHSQRAIATALLQAIDGLTSIDPAMRADTEITVVADLLRDEHGEQKDSTSRSARSAVRGFIDNSGGFELVAMSPLLIESARNVLPDRLPPTPDADTAIVHPDFGAKPGGMSF